MDRRHARRRPALHPAPTDIQAINGRAIDGPAIDNLADRVTVADEPGPQLRFAPADVLILRTHLLPWSPDM
jgi:hypothetical protein